MQEEEEVVYLISEGPSSSATPASPSLVVAHQRPTPGTPPSLVGGLLYRGFADTTLTGRYCFGFIEDGFFLPKGICMDYWIIEFAHGLLDLY